MLYGYTISDKEKKEFEEKIDSLITQVSTEIQDLSKGTSEEAIKKLLIIQNLILPSILGELKNSSGSLFRTRVLDRASNLISSMLSAAIKLREFEIKENVDVVGNPKINLMFIWFIDVIKESMEEIGLDKVKFFEVFSNKLSDWEIKVEQRLKKLSFRDIVNSNNLDNPLKVNDK